MPWEGAAAPKEAKDPGEEIGNRRQQRKAHQDSTEQMHPRPQGKTCGNQPDPVTRGPNQGAAFTADKGGMQDVVPQARDERSRRVTNVRRDLASHIQTMKNRDRGGTSRKASLGMGAQLMSVEAEMDGIIQTYGRRIGEVGVHWNLAKERDGISKELCNGIRRAKDLSYKTAKDTDDNYIKLGVELRSIKRLALPKSIVSPGNGQSSIGASRQFWVRTTQPC